MFSLSHEYWAVYVVVALFCGLAVQMVTERSRSVFAVSFVLSLTAAVVAAFLGRSAGTQGPISVTINSTDVAVLWPVVGATTAALLVAYFRSGRSSST